MVNECSLVNPYENDEKFKQAVADHKAALDALFAKGIYSVELVWQMTKAFYKKFPAPKFSTWVWNFDGVPHLLGFSDATRRKMEAVMRVCTNGREETNEHQNP